MLNQDEYYSILVRDNFTCKQCGKTPGISGLQIAHRIKNGVGTENYIQNYYHLKHGFNFALSMKTIKAIINHPDNLVTVCSLRCNDKQNIFYNPVERDELLLQIIDKVVFNKGVA